MALRPGCNRRGRRTRLAMRTGASSGLRSCDRRDIDKRSSGHRHARVILRSRISARQYSALHASAQRSRMLPALDRSISLRLAQASPRSQRPAWRPRPRGAPRRRKEQC